MQMFSVKSVRSNTISLYIYQMSHFLQIEVFTLFTFYFMKEVLQYIQTFYNIIYYLRLQMEFHPENSKGTKRYNFWKITEDAWQERQFLV